VSGLILPRPKKLWRPDFRAMLMAHLQLVSGHLSKTSGDHLSLCATDLQCCAQDPPTSLTIVGATGCLTFLNGTFALTIPGSPPCRAEYGETYSAPIDCTSGFCTTTVVSGVTRYWHPQELIIQVTRGDFADTPPTRMDVLIQGVVAWYVVAPSCTFGGIEVASTLWSRELCQSGTFSLDFDSSPTTGTNPTSISMAF
jgi:hypothetical protein